MWELDYTESWAQKNWCFWTVVLEKILESPLDCKEIQPVHPKGHQSWVFIGRTDVEAETPILWPPDAKSWLILKRLWCWERLRAGGEGDDRGWDGWMASLTRWTCIWAGSRSWWWTGKPSVLQFMRSQSQTQLSDWTELNWYRVFCWSEAPASTQLVLCESFCIWGCIVDPHMERDVLHVHQILHHLVSLNASFYLVISIYLFWLDDTLQYCDGFCRTSTWISHSAHFFFYINCVFLFSKLPHPFHPLPFPPTHLPPASFKCSA